MGSHGIKDAISLFYSTMTGRKYVEEWRHSNEMPADFVSASMHVRSHEMNYLTRAQEGGDGKVAR